MKYHKVIILLFGMLVQSCTNKEDNKLFGQILGSAAGAYLGSKFGSGVGKDLSIILGGAVGFLVGGKIAEILDKEEQHEHWIFHHWRCYFCHLYGINDLEYSLFE